MADECSLALIDFLSKALAYARAGGDIGKLIGKAMPDYSDGVMVAFYPSEDLSNYLMPFSKMDDLHLTLAYLGTLGEQAIGLEDAAACLSCFAEFSLPVHGRLNGIARFYGVEDGKDVIVALFDSPELPRWRQQLAEALELDQLRIRSEHGFIPHITLDYVEEDMAMPDFRLEKRVTIFNTVCLVWGTQILSFRLRGT